jgi:hypothetical protein
MKISMYQASAPRFANTLRNLSAILDKADAHAGHLKLDPTVIGNLRLIADMFPLSRQVQIACDTAKGAVARLAGVDIPKHEDTEQTIPELKARIAKTIAFVESVPQSSLEGSEDREVVMKMRSGEVKYAGLQYLMGHAYPNFYFHVTTAYNILRANGVEIGKRDYIGNP